GPGHVQQDLAVPFRSGLAGPAQAFLREVAEFFGGWRHGARPLRFTPALRLSWPSARAEILWLRWPVRSHRAKNYAAELSLARPPRWQSKDPVAREACCP